jgi:hypothetical protein
MAKFNPEHIVHVLATSNPKRPGTKSAAYWACYKQGQTVAEFSKAHAQRKAAFTPAAVLAWDVAHGFVAVLPKGQQPKVKGSKAAAPAKQPAASAPATPSLAPTPQPKAATA